ncbi:Ran-binding protein in the microtubule-organising centre protein (macronuclear) [Tetrahymena thermophila SB210]|uniref:Ran-binding protein in the microtubule-organising centre protein n=1 Tax=Tetrahymena thermophila (strain SB210) TaxID=312017 RepID=Q24CD8_TETTS|nr:Ran-binding protein in the microtubule-organising centre protein [Tetrahymena thermophila SB210]EAS05436.2 Ran-binding protein in the microtubule-organising centre protein [Tetrahymena thermophila SB210]|eukprot:XP_001025681.2 Ran-binding protein in the microtubule-organising centre protein [Tetrahymena thermophila SB210]
MNSFSIDSNKKKQISLEQWKEELKNVKIAKQDMNKLIMNFFLIEGYKEAAEKFREESQTEISEQDLECMQPRIDIRKLILNGQIDEAINELDKINKKVLEENKDINFNIKLQKCIELIRSEQIDKAISFAQEELLPILESSNEKKELYQDSMEKVMSLLAFENLQESPYQDLVSNSQRIKISSQINYEMLKGQQEKENKLPTLIKLLLWSQDKLSEKLEFPQIKNVSTAKFVTDNGNGSNNNKANQLVDYD